MKDFFGLNIPKLGFGLMRLPRLQDGKTIDVAQSEIMTDKFLEAGLKYFDTAYVYEGSELEKQSNSENEGTEHVT